MISQATTGQKTGDNWLWDAHPQLIPLPSTPVSQAQRNITEEKAGWVYESKEQDGISATRWCLLCTPEKLQPGNHKVYLPEQRESSSQREWADLTGLLP